MTSPTTVRRSEICRNANETDLSRSLLGRAVDSRFRNCILRTRKGRSVRNAVCLDRTQDCLTCLLSGRPTKHSPTQDVQMDVVDRLPGARVHVEYRAIALFVDIRLHRQFLGNLKHLANQRTVLRQQVIQCRNMLLGHHQEMNGRLRPKIFECHDEVIFMHKVRGCFAFNDSAKKTCLLHGFNLALLGAILCTTLLATPTPSKTPFRRIRPLSREPNFSPAKARLSLAWK